MIPKFRGLTKEGKWVKGWYVYNRLQDTHYIFDDRAKGSWRFEVLPETVGMSTGLPDKDGKENFHKDILDWDGNRFVIEWDDDSGQWYGRPMIGNKERGILAGCAFKNTINIGTIAKNPELLEGKE